MALCSHIHHHSSLYSKSLSDLSIVAELFPSEEGWKRRKWIFGGLRTPPRWMGSWWLRFAPGVRTIATFGPKVTNMGLCAWLSPDKMYTAYKRVAQEYPLVEEAYHKKWKVPVVHPDIWFWLRMFLPRNSYRVLFKPICSSEAQWQCSLHSWLENSQHPFAGS